MMILANSEWALMLADHGVPGIYRSQLAGRVKRQHPGGAPGPRRPSTWTTPLLRRYRTSSTSGSCSPCSPARSPRSATTTPSCSRSSARSRRATPRISTSSTAWSATGACAGSVRRPAPRTGRRRARRPGPARRRRCTSGCPGCLRSRRGAHLVVDLLATDEVDLSIEARFVELGAAAEPSGADEPVADGEDALAEQAADAGGGERGETHLIDWPRRLRRPSCGAATRWLSRSSSRCCCTRWC